MSHLPSTCWCTECCKESQRSVVYSHRSKALARLVATAEAFPNLRLCQIIVNATHMDEPFYVTDEDLAKALDDYTREWDG
jgi:hypothetical protein